MALFIKDRTYNRRTDIHEPFGGQRQGGISTPATGQAIFLFTGDSGKKFGYQDKWSGEGWFELFGEGQIGDMVMHKGNAAILNHIQNRKDIHLFEKVRRYGYRYMGQMICVGHQWLDNVPDVNGDLRKAVVFHLLPIEISSGERTEEDFRPEELRQDLYQLRARAEADSSIAPTRKNVSVTAVVRANAVKLYALSRAAGVCERCDLPAPFKSPKGVPFLEVHHLTRLADCGPDHVENVAAICPNCHRLVHLAQDSASHNDLLAQKIRNKETAIQAKSPQR